MSNLEMVVWNMEWMNDLFGPNNEPARFKPDDEVTAQNKRATIKERRDDLGGVLNELNADLIVIVEGPNRTQELQLFFDTDVKGKWKTHVQYSKGQTQNIGIAIRRDTNKFRETPFKSFDTNSIDTFNDFFADTDGDKIPELHKYERKPLYIEIYPKIGLPFRVLGLHLKSKGIFSAYEWSKWWQIAEGNRKKILAQASNLRYNFLDEYLTESNTQNIPLIVCGDINDGPGLDASEKKIFGSAIERIMGSVWNPQLCLGNAIFDSLTKDEKETLDFTKPYTTSYEDPIFNDIWHKVWIDHVLYTNNLPQQWVTKATIYETMKSGKKIWEEYKNSSGHFPISIIINA